MAIGIQHAMDKTVQFYSKKLDREQNMQNSNSNNGTMAFGSNQQGIPGKFKYSDFVPYKDIVDFSVRRKNK